MLRLRGYCRKTIFTALPSVVRTPYSALEATPMMNSCACVREPVSMVGPLTGTKFTAQPQLP